MSYHFAPMLTQDGFQMKSGNGSIDRPENNGNIGTQDESPGKRSVGRPKGSKINANIGTQDESPGRRSVGRPKGSKNKTQRPISRRNDPSALSNPGMYVSLPHMLRRF